MIGRDCHSVDKGVCIFAQFGDGCCQSVDEPNVVTEGVQANTRYDSIYPRYQTRAIYSLFGTQKSKVMDQSDGNFSRREWSYILVPQENINYS